MRTASETQRNQCVDTWFFSFFSHFLYWFANKYSFKRLRTIDQGFSSLLSSCPLRWQSVTRLEDSGRIVRVVMAPKIQSDSPTVPRIVQIHARSLHSNPSFSFAYSRSMRSLLIVKSHTPRKSYNIGREYPLGIANRRTSCCLFSSCVNVYIAGQVVK